MNKNEKRLLLDHYKELIIRHSENFVDYTTVVFYKEMLCKLGLKEDVYRISNDFIAENESFPFMLKHLFKLTFEELLEKGYYLSYNLNSLEEIYDNYQFTLSDEDKRAWEYRIQHMKDIYDTIV